VVFRSTGDRPARSVKVDFAAREYKFGGGGETEDENDFECASGRSDSNEIV
jgi:hypothetical protein